MSYLQIYINIVWEIIQAYVLVLLQTFPSTRKTFSASVSGISRVKGALKEDIWDIPVYRALSTVLEVDRI